MTVALAVEAREAGAQAWTPVLCRICGRWLGRWDRHGAGVWYCPKCKRETAKPDQRPR